nr:AstE [Aspergillus stellatus]
MSRHYCLPFLLHFFFQLLLLFSPFTQGTTSVEPGNESPEPLLDYWYHASPVAVPIPVTDDPSEQAMVTARNDEFRAAFASADVDRLMSFFAPQALYSDYAIAALDMDYASTRTYFETMFAGAQNLSFTQTSITGYKHFAAAEWVLTMSATNASQSHATTLAAPGSSGDTGMEMRGASLTWYDEAGEKILRNCDYGVLWPPAAAV